MKNTIHPQFVNAQLAQYVDQISQLTMESVFEIDHFAGFKHEPSDLVFCNELASSLELMQSQIDYYFPNGDGLVESDEWPYALAALNSSSDWIDDQILEIDTRFETAALSERLQELSSCYVEAIPLLIASRLAQEETDCPEPTVIPQRAVEEPSRSFVEIH